MTKANEEICKGELRGFSIGSVTRPLDLDPLPEGDGVGVAVITTADGPRILLSVHEDAGSMLIAALSPIEFVKLSKLMQEAARSVFISLDGKGTVQ